MEQKESLIRWEEIEPTCVARLFRRRFWMILMAGLIGMMCASILLGATTKRTYNCSTTFSVTTRLNAASNNYFTNSAAASEVVAIYSELLQGRFMKEIVHEDALSSAAVGTITANQLRETNLIKVTVNSASPRDSLLIMQSILRNYTGLSDYVASTAVLTALSTPTLASASSGLADNPGKITALAGIVCALAMAAALFWISISRGTIQNREGARNNLDGRIIASVPHEHFAPGRKQHRKRATLNITSNTISFGYSESIHQVAAKIEHEKSKGKKVFLFTSVSEAEGKSTLAANTSLSLAMRGQKVLFIDLDLRRPVQADFLGATLGEFHSLGDLLARGVSAREILLAAVTEPTTGMQALLSDKSYSDMIELIASPAMEETIALARDKYDYIIIDSPPLGYFTDSEVIGDHSDGTILVVRQDTVPAPRINDAIDSLRACRAEFLGIVLNDMETAASRVLGYGGEKNYDKYKNAKSRSGRSHSGYGHRSGSGYGHRSGSGHHSGYGHRSGSGHHSGYGHRSGSGYGHRSGSGESGDERPAASPAAESAPADPEN